MTETADRFHPVRKSIIMAGGHGTRLYPLTRVLNKHLLPVYDKPLIYYPLTTVMLSGVSEILVISATGHLPDIRGLLGDGSQWGISVTYAEQKHPGGIAEALLIGETFIDGDPFALILGDNFFYGYALTRHLADGARAAAEGRAAVFTFRVTDPRAYGVLELDAQDRPVAIIEKPASPRSNRAVTGLYFYPAGAAERAGDLRPSGRGELEITDLNRAYLDEGRLHPIHLERGLVWFDAGTTLALQQVSAFVEIVQTRQNTGIAFPEEVAFHMGSIGLDSLERLVSDMPRCAYRQYLDNFLTDLRQPNSESR